jgi:hypothetical protein
MKLTREQIEQHKKFIGMGATCTPEFEMALCDMALSSLDEDKVLVPREPTEQEVERAARVIAASPGIDAPKLGYQEWMGLARKILLAAGREE